MAWARDSRSCWWQWGWLLGWTRRFEAVVTNDALLQAIVDDPDDDTIRLIYADWFDDNGEPERAEFIRAQCLLAKLAACDPRRQPLRDRSRFLLRQHGGGWIGPIGHWLRGGAFRRGFLESVRVLANNY